MVEEKIIKQAEEEEEDISFKDYFVPFTTKKAIIFIALIGLIVYFNILYNGFVWDDLIYIINNPQIHNFSITTIFGESRFNSAGQYRPIPSLYFTLIYSLFKESSFFYHLLSIIIHVTNSVLIFFLFKKFINKYMSFFLTIVFLVHPMQVESVAFASTSANNLFFTFGLLALILSLKEQLNPNKILLVACLLLLSILSKETGILFLILILLDRIFYKRKSNIKLLTTSALIIITYLILRLGVGQIFLEQQLGFIPIETLSLGQRLINIPAIINYYISTFLFPLELAVMQYWVVDTVNYTNFYLPLFLCLIFFTCLGLSAVFFIQKGFKAFIFFTLWFIIGMLLHLQIFPLTMTVADRWFYFSMVGLLGILGIILQGIVSKYKKLNSSYVLWAIGGLILVLLSIRTIERNTNWRNNLTLYTHDAKIHKNFILENNLGVEYRRQNNLKSAKKHFENSVNLHPYQGNLFNLAIVSNALGDKQQAREYFFKILTVTDHQGKEYNGQAYRRSLTMTSWVLIQLDSPANSKAFIQHAIKKNPNNGYLWANLAVSEYKLNNHKAALNAITKARSLSQSPVIQNLQLVISSKESIPENLNISFFNEISQEHIPY